ncbi:MAG: NUDIX domain-containing protein, partial [Acholeplasmatales bacterium]|nr:NUDIX domain-containing protein [Acholeplasmatales bacterium]
MYCSKCGNVLEKKFLEHEGMINFCKCCNEYVFDRTNVAVSMIILNPDETKMLFIKQYGKDKFILVAGYTNPGESLEHTVYREMGEEIGRYPKSIEFNMSKYFAPSNTLISNFICKLTSMDIFPNEEIDY